MRKKKRMGAWAYVMDMISRYRRGAISGKEKEILENWNPDPKDLEVVDQTSSFVNEYTELVWQRLEKKIRKQPIIIRMWKPVAAAAVLALVVGTSWLFWQTTPEHQGGKELVADTRHHWTTDDRQRTKITLPDGSIVQLNAGSRLEIIENTYNKEMREVWLAGEAFFEVEKNPQKPFIIHTEKMQTVVRGTSFNLKAYPELEENVVSVRNGLVEVLDGIGQLALLTENRQLRYNVTDQTTEVSDVDWRDASGWTEGRLVLNGASGEELKLRIKQQFGIEVNIQGNALKGKRVHGVFGTNSSLPEVLDAISLLYNINYQIEQKMINIYPN